MRASWILCFACLLGASAMADAATIYKWTDTQGQVHFGSQPPVGHPSETISTRSVRLPAPATVKTPTTEQVADNQSDIDREVKREIAREQAELRQFCTRARTNLAQLNNNPRLLTEIDGKTVRLTEQERQERIRQAQEQIKEHCQGL